MIAAAVALGAFLRLAMVLGMKSLWGDEWFTVDLVSRPLPQVLAGAVSDVHPPLYFLAARGFVAALGTAEWVFRLPSLLAGLGAVVLTGRLARHVAGPAAGAAAAFGVALSPYFIQSSNEIRGYALFGCLAAGAYAFFLKAAEERAVRRSTLVWASLFLSLAAWSEHYGWFVWAAVTLAALVETRGLRDCRALALPSAVALAAACPSLLLAVRQALTSEQMFDASRVREYLSAGLLAKKTAGIFWHWTCGYRFSMLTVPHIAVLARSSPAFALSAAATAAASLLAAGEFFGPGRRAPRWRVLLAAGLFLPLVFLAFVYPVRLDARYLAFSAPLFFAAGASGIFRFRSKAVRAVLLGLLGIVSLWGSAHAILLPTDAVHREDYRGLVRWVSGHARPGDAAAGLGPQMRYYGREWALPAARFEGLDDFLAAGAGYPRVWVLSVTNMHPDVARRIHDDNDRRLTAAGYRALEPTRRFPPADAAEGGEGGLATLDLYGRDS